MITIKYAGGIYACERRKGGRVGVAAQPGRATHANIVDSEEAAIRWLCDRSLRKSKAKQLVEAALRNEGPLADPKHYRRVHQCPTTAQS
jgi:hypothetical protein